MKIVTICGSMRFAKQMQEIAYELGTKFGYCVIQPLYSCGSKEIKEEELEKLVKAHYKKIDISDAIYVVNVGGYIGKSTSEEIEYAKKHNKEIIYHES